MTNVKDLSKLLEEVVILYVEDEEEIRAEMYQILCLFSKKVLLASNGIEAYDIFCSDKPDIIITDIEMPKQNGIEFVQQVRIRDLKIPIIMLTAYTDKEYLLPASNLNIQAYLVKPFESKKLKNALLQAVELLDLKQNVMYKLSNDLVYDQENGQLVHQEKDTIRLNKKEKTLMDLLVSNQHRVTTYEEIENYVWNEYDEVMTSMALRTIIKNLRKKSPFDFLKNISGQGYKLIIQ